MTTAEKLQEAKVWNFTQERGGRYVRSDGWRVEHNLHAGIFDSGSLSNDRKPWVIKDPDGNFIRTPGGKRVRRSADPHKLMSLVDNHAKAWLRQRDRESQMREHRRAANEANKLERRMENMRNAAAEFGIKIPREELAKAEAECERVRKIADDLHPDKR